MALRRTLLASAGLLVFLSGPTSGSSQESGPWLASHLENGQRIYMSGVTAQGRVVQNSHGMEGVGCAMCHGPDGRGGTMHGIPVPNITVPFLTDPRGNEHNGRKRPAYNEETIKAAIVAGIDSGGNWTISSDSSRRSVRSVGVRLTCPKDSEGDIVASLIGARPVDTLTLGTIG